MTTPAGTGRYRVTVTDLHANEPTIVFEDQGGAYIAGVADSFPTSVTYRVDHNGSFRLRELLVEEIQHAVLDTLT
ncbi:MAG: hypothetical protein ACYDEN_01365 [Acidimicrobiales bacterium]